MNKPKIVKWTLDVDNFKNIVDTISLVDEPAIEVEWMAFDNKKSKIRKQSEMDEFALLSMVAEEQRLKYLPTEVPKERFQQFIGENIIVAPAMIADKLLLRLDEDGDPFYGFFDEVAVKNAAYAFQKYKLTDRFNINHDENEIAEGIYLAESWLVLDTELDKSKYFGYSLPKGTWFTILKIDNDALYREYIESGLLSGLSVEAYVLEKVILTKTNLNKHNTNG